MVGQPSPQKSVANDGVADSMPLLGTMTTDSPQISLLGTDALLFDPGDGVFEAEVQQRLLALAHELESEDRIIEAVVGMNNLTVQYNTSVADPASLSIELTALWETVEPIQSPSVSHEAPTVYGGEDGGDLAELAERLGVPVSRAAEIHAEPTYTVAAVAAMPGFVYLSGLNPALACPRRASPRPSVAAGTVIVGGAQTGIMPVTAPTGWRCVGRTELRLFDLKRDPPALLAPGDAVRFTILDILA